MDITRHNPGPRMSQAVEHNGTVYLAGQVANDQNADIGEQTRQVLSKIDALLGKCGSDKSKLLWAQLWVTDMRNFAAMNEVWDPAEVRQWEDLIERARTEFSGR